MSWLSAAAHHRWLEQHTDHLLHFARPGALKEGGFGYLDTAGQPVPGHVRDLWITCRMTHSFALGTLLGRPGYAALVDHGLAALAGPFADPEHPGWFSSLPAVPDAGAPLPASTLKEAYPHAFVILATASATVAGRPGAAELLQRALEVSGRYFWDEEAGLVVEAYNRDFTQLDDYRGVNANMHTVEAYLAAADVTGDAVWRERAARITSRVVGWARGNSWRIPEHFTPTWEPLLEYNADKPADQFRPYGATIGHSLEWARLALHVAAACGDPDGLLTQGARELYAGGMRDGWAVDGAEGFVYTIDWSGKPVVRERMHWVVCEAIGAAAALHRATGEDSYAADYQRMWEFAARYLLDPVGGSWHHELDTHLAPGSAVWPGKPDIYHAIQATLVPRLPLSPVLAPALAAGLLDA